MEWLLSRPAVTGLAVTGALLSLSAMALRGRQGREKLARQFDVSGYAFMGISVLMFIIAGFRGPR